MAKDFKGYEDLLWHRAASFGIQVGYLQENMHRLLDILQPSALWSVALPINDAFLEPAKAL